LAEHSVIGKYDPFGHFILSTLDMSALPGLCYVSSMPIQISAVHRNILVEEVLVQANLALGAYGELRRLVTNPETRQRRDCWAHMQSLLAHTAMISKFMNPPNNSAVSRARAKTLRDAFGVEDRSPIFSRSARNNVEHLDERIDKWISTGPERVLEMAFDNREGYDFLNRPEAGEQRRWFVKRVYLVAEDVFMSEGREGIEDIDLAALSTELRRIRETAQDFLARDEAVVRLGPLGT
jgi:hypothetical protein